MAGLSGNAFFSMGFRPFFLAGASWAALAMLAWVLILTGHLALPTSMSAASWHAHESLFGYLGAVFTGFLLTAVPNWTGRPHIEGPKLAILLLLWILGRVAITFSTNLPLFAVALVDLSLLIATGLISLREIAAAKNWRNLVVVALIAGFVAANALFHWEVAQGIPAASGFGLRLGLAIAVLMISLIGGRIVPAFTRNWMVKRNKANPPAASGLLDKIALAVSLLALTVWVVVPSWQGTGLLLLTAGAVQFARLGRWRGIEARGEPLVWILHIGYSCVPLGMLALGSTILWSGPVSNIEAQHIWTAGAVGLMTLAVMTRASLGHTGRDLVADIGTTGIYSMIILSLVARLLGDLVPDLGLQFLVASAVSWITGFAGFVILYGPMLMRPRADN